MAKIIFEQDNIQYVFLTKDRLTEAVEVGRKSFFVDETVCTALDLKNNPTAMNELQELFVRVAEDGVSVLGVDKITDSVVAISFNKLQAQNRPDAEHYEKYSDRCSDPASKAFLAFMKGTDLAIDMFEVCQVDCYMEIMFLGVLSNYRGKSIAYNLCRASEIVARILFSGQNVKQSITGTPLTLEPCPKCISAIFTSVVSQKIGQKLNMKVAKMMKLDVWTYKGQTLVERLGNNVAPIQYYYKMF